MGFSFATLNSSSTISDVNANFALVEAKLGNITNADLADDAGITSAKLADRYTVAYQTVLLSATTWGGSFTFENVATSGSVSEARIYPEFPGKRAFLCSVSISAQNYAEAASAEEGRVWVTINGTDLAYVDFTDPGSGTTSEVGYIRSGAGSSAFSSPLAALSEGDYVGIKVGKQSGTTNAPTCDFLTITFSYKIELTA